jgi:Fe-S cluster assembly scaffold protein SufB
MNKETFEITKPGVYEYSVIADTLGDEKQLVGVIRAETQGEYVIKILSNHKVGKSFCRVEVRGVVKSGARVNLSGRVKIDKDARGSDSFLAMKLLLLDNISMAVAEPELEIENNEVKASHSASVGMIDEEQLFYLMSRGLSKVEAEKVIVEGFLGQ